MWEEDGGPDSRMPQGRKWARLQLVAPTFTLCDPMSVSLFHRDRLVGDPFLKSLVFIDASQNT